MRHKLIALALVLASVSGAATFAPQGFAFTGVHRFVTPNGDRKNDTADFRYENPQDSAGTIRIFELRGRLTATVPIVPGCTTGCSVSWDPRGAADGIYIYVLTIDQTSKSGVVVVVR